MQSYTSKIDIFTCSYIFIPIGMNNHWLLYIFVFLCYYFKYKQLICRSLICLLHIFPCNQEDNSNPNPCILFMDSLRIHNGRSIAQQICKLVFNQTEKYCLICILSSYLELEWKERKQTERRFILDKTISYCNCESLIPLQYNKIDCGLFICKYVQAIIQKLPQYNLSSKPKLSNFLHPHEFNTNDVEQERMQFLARLEKQF